MIVFYKNLAAPDLITLHANFLVLRENENQSQPVCPFLTHRVRLRRSVRKRRNASLPSEGVLQGGARAAVQLAVGDLGGHGDGGLLGVADGRLGGDLTAVQDERRGVEHEGGPAEQAVGLLEDLGDGGTLAGLHGDLAGGGADGDGLLGHL